MVFVRDLLLFLCAYRSNSREMIHLVSGLLPGNPRNWIHGCRQRKAFLYGIRHARSDSQAGQHWKGYTDSKYH